MPLYLNGRWNSRPLTTEDGRHLGFHFGLGVFTTLGVCEGRPVFLARHLDRLEHNARLLNLSVPSRDTIRTLVREGIRRSGRSSAVIKIMVAPPAMRAGNGEDSTRLALLVMPGRSAPRAVDLLVSPLVPTRWHAHKLTAYIDAAILAGRARGARCFDALAVAGGELLDTSMANIFRVDRAGIQTPPADGRILPGIARQQLLAVRELGIQERRLYVRDLHGALGLFLTNSVRGPIPVGRLLDDRRKILWRSAGGASVPRAVSEAYQGQLRNDFRGSE